MGEFEDYVDQQLSEGLAYAQDHYDEWRASVGIPAPAPIVPTPPNRAQRRGNRKARHTSRS